MIGPSINMDLDIALLCRKKTLQHAKIVAQGTRIEMILSPQVHADELSSAETMAVYAGLRSILAGFVMYFAGRSG